MNNGLKDQVDKLGQAAGSLSGDVIKYSVLIFIVLVVLYVGWKIIQARRRKPVEESPDLRINTTGLGTEGPPPGPLVLEYYHQPVRLAAIVLAPVGRVRSLPPDNQLGPVVDALVPGLAKVAAAHRPLVRRWPPQLSPRGFAHAFFAHVQRPGEPDQPSPWCTVAGTFKVGGQPVMAGLVLRAAGDVNIGPQIIDEEGKWLDLLRVKSSG